MPWWRAAPRSSVVFGLLLVGASGCANLSNIGAHQPSTPSEPLMVPAETQRSSRSDRLRGGLDYVPASAPEPATPQERPRPQPSETTPPQGTDEPDPRAVIDWLLKERR